MSVQISDVAPNFTLYSQNCKISPFNDFKGKNIVLYFYPKDDTSGCSAQACAFRDLHDEFEKLNTVILGVSRDPVNSHIKFSEKYKLPFPLLSDEDGKVCEKYGVWVEKSMYGKKYMGIQRTTFLIDSKGIVRHIWSKVRVPGHIQDVIEKIKGL